MPRALHVIAGIHPKNGGPSYSVPRLCQALQGTGFDARILALDEGAFERPENVTVFPQTAGNLPILGRLKLSRPMHRGLMAQSRKASIVHSHGLWLAPNIYAGKAAACAGLPLIVSPRGMVSREALQFSPRLKNIMWRLTQGKAYAKAATWHATSMEEALDVRAFGIEAPIAVIPNGIDLPEAMAVHLPEKKHRTLLFLSRIHPKKGLPLLLDAWAQVAPDRPEWRLVIAGPDEGDHESQLKTQAQDLGLTSVCFPGPLYGSAKQDLLQDADLFVLPTLNENFGIAVAEALAAGVPAIVTRGAPWAGLMEHRCGWWIDQGVEPLVIALRQATGLSPQARRDMGFRGRHWMDRDFGWEAIGRQMKDVYLWLAGLADRPACVQLD